MAGGHRQSAISMQLQRLPRSPRHLHMHMHMLCTRQCSPFRVSCHFAHSAHSAHFALFACALHNPPVALNSQCGDMCIATKLISTSDPQRFGFFSYFFSLSLSPPPLASHVASLSLPCLLSSVVYRSKHPFLFPLPPPRLFWQRRSFPHLNLSPQTPHTPKTHTP